MFINTGNISRKVLSKVLRSFDKNFERLQTLNVYTHVGLEDAEKELQKMQGLENARKEMGISDTDDKPLKQNMFKVV